MWAHAKVQVDAAEALASNSGSSLGFLLDGWSEEAEKQDAPICPPFDAWCRDSEGGAPPDPPTQALRQAILALSTENDERMRRQFPLRGLAPEAVRAPAAVRQPCSAQ